MTEEGQRRSQQMDATVSPMPRIGPGCLSGHWIRPDSQFFVQLCADACDHQDQVVECALVAESMKSLNNFFDLPFPNV